MHIRLTLSAGLVACALAAAALALDGDPDGAGDPGSSGGSAALTAQGAGDGARKLHPKHTSGGEPGTIASPRPAGGLTATENSRTTWQVAPGVTFTRWSQTDARGPIRAHLLTIDPSTPGLKVDYASMGAVRRVAPVTDILALDHAVAGVNGDFYDIGHTGAPLGLGQDRQRGLLHARQDGWNNAFFISRNGRAGIGDLPMQARILYHPRLQVTNLNSPFVTPGGIGIYTGTVGPDRRVRRDAGPDANGCVRCTSSTDGSSPTGPSSAPTDRSRACSWSAAATAPRS